jgi:hypothetical protein
MGVIMRIVQLLLFVVWTMTLLALAEAGAAPHASQPVVSDTARPSAETSTAAEDLEVVYGPIRAKDPLQRARIKELYIELHGFRETTMETLSALGENYARERDSDFRAAIAREITDAKGLLERRSMEIGLEIARLNEDAARVEEFSRALDALLNPQRPASLPTAERTPEPIPGRQ